MNTIFILDTMNILFSEHNYQMTISWFQLLVLKISLVPSFKGRTSFMKLKMLNQNTIKGQ